MQISSMFGAQDLDPSSMITEGKRRRYEGGITSTLAQGDVVNISEEALALAAKWQQEWRKQAQKQAEEENLPAAAVAGQSLAQQFASGALAPDEEAKGAIEMTEQEVPGEQAIGGASAQESIESLEKRIEELQKKIITVHASDLPEDTKEAQISSLQAQISQLVQELSAAKQQAAKKG